MALYFPMKLSRDDKIRRREIYRLMYRMQRKYGTRAAIYQFTPGTLDPRTGKPSGETREKIELRRFVSWDATINQKFEYDISFIKANSNFAYGGLFEVGDRIALLSRENLGESFELNTSHYVVLKGKRYNVHRFIDIDPRAGYLMHLRRVNSQKLHQVIERTVYHFIDVRHESSSS